MRYAIALAAALAAQQAHAAPAEAICQFNDGTKVTTIASGGKVILRLNDGEWRDAFSNLKGDIITVTHISDKAYIRVAFDPYKRTGAGVIRSLEDERILWESKAAYWFK